MYSDVFYCGNAEMYYKKRDICNSIQDATQTNFIYIFFFRKRQYKRLNESEMGWLKNYKCLRVRWVYQRMKEDNNKKR